MTQSSRAFKMAVSCTNVYICFGYSSVTECGVFQFLEERVSVIEMNDFYDVKTLDDFLFDVEDNGTELKMAAKNESNVIDRTPDTAAASDKVDTLSDKDYYDDGVEEGINKAFIKLATLSKFLNKQKNRL